jgi:folate-binding protein YgfZ
VPEQEHAFVDHGDALYVSTDVGIDVIRPAGAPPLDLPGVSDEAAELLRIESGRPRLGFEFDSDTIPQEAGLNERGVNFEKGCYVGQETVARLHYKGKPNRHLRGLRLSEPAERGAELRLGDRVVGAIGSSAVSPVHGPIALALVRREAEPGATLDVGETGATAEVIDVPFRTNAE